MLKTALALLLCAGGIRYARADEEKKAEVSDADRIRQLVDAQSESERAAAARALGDRHASGEIVLTDENRKTLDRAVAGYIQAHAMPRTRMEAERQIQRLWRLAVPGLLQGLDRDETFSFSARMLALMRNEEVVLAVIEKAAAKKNSPRATLYRLALNNMRNAPPRPRVKGREVVDAEEAERLYRELIEPALAKLP